MRLFGHNTFIHSIKSIQGSILAHDKVAFIFLMMLLLPIKMGLAAETYPKSCKPIVITDEQFSISQHKKQLILVHNMSDIDIWLSSDAVSSIKLGADQWSALLLPLDQDTTLSCVESRPGHEQLVSCHQTISACKWASKSIKSFEYAQSESEPHWLTESQNLSVLLAFMKRKGLIQ